MLCCHSSRTSVNHSTGWGTFPTPPRDMDHFSSSPIHFSVGIFSCLRPWVVGGFINRGAPVTSTQTPIPPPCSDTGSRQHCCFVFTLPPFPVPHSSTSLHTIRDRPHTIPSVDPGPPLWEPLSRSPPNTLGGGYHPLPMPFPSHTWTAYVDRAAPPPPRTNANPSAPPLMSYPHRSPFETNFWPAGQSQVGG